MELELKEKLSKLEEIGYRRTPQREAVIKYLSYTDTHPSADEIHRELEKEFPNLSLATIYNNLHFLTNKGVIKELYCGNESSRFDFNTTDHYHIMCESCRKIEDFKYPLFYEVEAFAEEFYEYNIKFHSLELYGICKDCQTN
ncbi:Fur family transcriptional regulator [Virgibacillus ainsalahensis]